MVRPQNHVRVRGLAFGQVAVDMGVAVPAALKVDVRNDGATDATLAKLRIGLARPQLVCEEPAQKRAQLGGISRVGAVRARKRRFAHTCRPVGFVQFHFVVRKRFALQEQCLFQTFDDRIEQGERQLAAELRLEFFLDFGQGAGAVHQRDDRDDVLRYRQDMLDLATRVAQSDAPSPIVRESDRLDRAYLGFHGCGQGHSPAGAAFQVAFVIIRR